MARLPAQVFIPFRPLLVQLTDCLEFEPPKYKLIDEANNNVLISIAEPLSAGTHIYIGGSAPTISESCENAARQAVRGLMHKFSIVVEDVTSTRQALFEKCSTLYKLKCNQFGLLEKGEHTPALYESHEQLPLPNSRIVTLNYMPVLHVICQKLGLKCVDIDTVEHDPTHFTSFTLIDMPRATKIGQCLIGECCSDVLQAQNNLAEKAVLFLASAHNLEIVDANHHSRASRVAPLDCAMQRESFRTIKERVLGIKEEMEPSCFLGKGDCLTPRGENHQVPTLDGPPLAPRKRRCLGFARSGAVVPQSRNSVPVFFKVPAPLETVFSIRKSSQ